MTEYETLVIMQPEWGAELVRQFTERVRAIVERHSGVMFLIREIGRRPLAYRVEKHERGIYLYFNYGGGGGLVAEIERACRLDEGVLKFLTTKLGTVTSVETRQAKVLEDEVRLAGLFGVGSEAPVVSDVEGGSERGPAHVA